MATTKLSGATICPLSASIRLEIFRVISGGCTNSPLQPSDGDGLIKPFAHVVLQEGVVADSQLEVELKAHVKKLLAPYKIFAMDPLHRSSVKNRVNKHRNDKTMLTPCRFEFTTEFIRVCVESRRLEVDCKSARICPTPAEGY